MSSRILTFGISTVVAFAASAVAHPIESTFSVNCEIAQVAGTLLLPHTEERVPCVVLIGGTLSHDRNGRLAQPGVPRRDALKRWAESLQAGGYASLRYDPVGRGESKPRGKWRGTYLDQAVAAAAVVDLARRDDRLGSVIVAGESAGAYVACLAAKAGMRADAYLFLGALCIPAPEMYNYNFSRFVKYADSTPERIHLAPGVEIIADITNSEKTVGVETLEGRIGPLILGTGSQAHFIDMPGGMFFAEHPHSSESLIYTVRGRWVLCSAGRRHVMQPGTLFRFGANIPTGYEVPFQENAFILIFKGDRLTKVEAEFIEYLRGMAARVEKERREGVPICSRTFPSTMQRGYSLGKSIPNTKPNSAGIDFPRSRHAPS